MTDKDLIARKFKELPDFVALENLTFKLFASSTDGSYHSLVEEKSHFVSPCPCGETYTGADCLLIPAEELLNSANLWGDCILQAKPYVSSLGFFDAFSDYLILFDAAETLKDLSQWEDMNFTQLLNLTRALIVLGEFDPPHSPIGTINLPAPRVLKVINPPPATQFANVWAAGPFLLNRLLTEFPVETAAFAVGENVNLEDLQSRPMFFISESHSAIWRESSRLMNALVSNRSNQAVTAEIATDKLERTESLVRLQLLIVLASTRTFKAESFTFFCAPVVIAKSLLSVNANLTEAFSLPQVLDSNELEFFSKFISLYFTDEKASTLGGLNTFIAASALKLGVIEPAWSSYQAAIR